MTRVQLVGHFQVEIWDRHVSRESRAYAVKGTNSRSEHGSPRDCWLLFVGPRATLTPATIISTTFSSDTDGVYAAEGHNHTNGTIVRVVVRGDSTWLMSMAS